MVKSMYVIVPTASVSIKMINLSTSRSVEDLRKNNDGSLSILRVLTPVHDAFLDYIWYTPSEILEELEKEGWNG